MFIYETIKQWVLDILFPISCIGCGKASEWLCQACLSTIKIQEKQVCPICRKQASKGTVCNECRCSSALSGLLVATSYDNQIIQNTIHALKYNFIQEVAFPLAKMLITVLNKIDNPAIKAILRNPENVIITAVPLHAKRKLERGFNQAALLAQSVANHYSLHYVPDLLQRRRHTEMQANLDKQNRIANMHNAFRVNKRFKKSQKNVILVDDVATTLSTLNECAKALRNNGHRAVWGIVVARGG